MAKEIKMTNFVAIGNGEPCPFCANEENRLVEDIFINDKDKDITEHMMNEHPSELNKALFSEPPPKLWLEKPFQLVVAKLSVTLRILDEDERVSHESFEESMHNMYSIMKDYFKNESN